MQTIVVPVVALLENGDFAQLSEAHGEASVKNSFNYAGITSKDVQWSIPEDAYESSECQHELLSNRRSTCPTEIY